MSGVYAPKIHCNTRLGRYMLKDAQRQSYRALKSIGTTLHENDGRWIQRREKCIQK